MTIDEAIARAREVEKYAPKEMCKCAEEHEQLAEWLEELKAYKETKCNKSVYLANKSIDMIDAFNKGYADGYNKAIYDFKKILTIEKIKEYAESDGFINLNNCSLMIFDIAEQLKVGGKNE